MPGDGAMILSHVREPAVVILCEPCGRRGRDNVERVMAEHGDAKLTNLLVTLADFPKARSVSCADHHPASVSALADSREGESALSLQKCPRANPQSALGERDRRRVEKA